MNYLNQFRTKFTETIFSAPGSVSTLPPQGYIPLFSWMSSLLKYLNSLVNWPTGGAGWLNVNKAKATLLDLPCEIFPKLS